MAKVVVPDNVKKIKTKIFMGQKTTFQERQIVKIFDNKNNLQTKVVPTLKTNNINSHDLLIRTGTRFKK